MLLLQRMLKGTSVFTVMAAYRGFQHAKSLYLPCFRHVKEVLFNILHKFIIQLSALRVKTQSIAG